MCTGQDSPSPTPNTGIITAFANRLLQGEAPEVYEDGLMTRDFVHVSDVVRALVRAGAEGSPERGIYNIGSGCAITVLSLAERMCALMAPGVSPQISGRARIGDVRHCTARTTLAASDLGFRAQVSLDAGLSAAKAGVINPVEVVASTMHKKLVFFIIAPHEVLI